MSASDPLAAYRAAEHPYRQARDEFRAALYARDAALLEARRAGLDDDHLLAATGLELGELWAAFARADAAASHGELVCGDPGASEGGVALTAVFEPVEGDWVQARLLEWPGVITAGRTREDARALLRDAAHEWLFSLDDRSGEPRGAHADYETLDVVIR